MKVWLYYRLSRDEDDELNSLTNQRKIIYEYAVTNGHEVVGESFDDNVSGMHFNREGIDKIYEVVEAGKIEAIIVKDLSRLGRHRTQTALFIDYLREHDVRVLSATENIDTFNENDDLIIGFKGLVNDFYARDGSRRVRTGYRQKQKEGLVTIPPFGYFKDKNTKKVVIVEEAAETVRLIFTAYVGGSGMKTIARTLNEQKRKTPALMQLELLNKSLPNTRTLSAEGMAMVQAMGADRQSIEDEAAYRPHWREEIYPVFFGNKTAPHEIIVLLDFASPDSARVWQAVRDASAKLSPADAKIAVFAKNTVPTSWAWVSGSAMSARARPWTT